MEESVDKRIKRITDYYEKESIEWLRKTIIEIKLAIKNSEKERLIKEQERKNKKSQKEQRLKNKKLANEIKKKNRQLRRNINLNKIKNRKLERLNSIKNNEAKNDILLNIKIPGKGLFLAIELNEKEKAKFYINENKIISLGISPSVNKLACKFFYYRNEISDKDGQYAENGRERRVWYARNRFFKLDYIDDKDKIILEWNENGHYHFNGVIRKENLIRKSKILFFYPDYNYIIIKENDYFPNGRIVKLKLRIKIFNEILVNIDKKLK